MRNRFYFGVKLMACCCKNYPPMIRASTIEVADGVTTITIPATPEVNSGDVVRVLLATAIPDGTDGTQVAITNGTVTAAVMNGNGNYFRPLPLNSRTVITVQYLADPAHWQILSITGRRTC